VLGERPRPPSAAPGCIHRTETGFCSDGSVSQISADGEVAGFLIAAFAPTGAGDALAPPNIAAFVVLVGICSVDIDQPPGAVPVRAAATIRRASMVPSRDPGAA